MTPQRKFEPQQSAGTTLRRLGVERTEVPESRCNDREKGDRKETTVTAGNKRMTSVPVVLHRPRFPAACQRSDPSERTQPCLPATFMHHEVLKQNLVSWFVPAPTTRTPLAHKPPASMSSSARRLRQKPFDERSAWKLPPAGSSPHCRRDSALF